MSAAPGREERPLHLDLHSHTYYSPDGITSPQRFVAACQRKGITCVAVTDHNTIRGALAVKEMAPFLVIVGAEIRSREGEIIGLFLSDEVPPDLSAQETIERIRAQDGLVSLPHPLDRFRGLNGFPPYSNSESRQHPSFGYVLWVCITSALIASVTLDSVRFRARDRFE